MRIKQDAKKVFLILHNIRSAHNVGAIFRTADASGVAKIYCTGYTPAPVDRFGKARGDIAKVALGAEKSVVWGQNSNITALIKKMKRENINIVALEQDKKAINYRKFRVKKPTALVLGNEVGGIGKNILKLCDTVIEIPMRGKKESLNVSIAAGIALFGILGI